MNTLDIMECIKFGGIQVLYNIQVSVLITVILVIFVVLLF